MENKIWQNFFDKKFVHFVWSDELEGKEGFFADSINILKCYVEDNDDNLIGIVSVSDRGDFPFLKNNGADFRFFYYDPNYECKCAYTEGKQIEVKNGNSWIDVYGEPTWDLSNIYRIKPEATKDSQEENARLKKENEKSEWHNLNENSKDLPNEGEWVEGLYIWYYKDEPKWDVFKVRWYYEIGELDEKLVRWYGNDEYNTYERDYWNKVDEPDYWRKITLPMRNEHDRNY